MLDRCHLVATKGIFHTDFLGRPHLLGMAKGKLGFMGSSPLQEVLAASPTQATLEAHVPSRKHEIQVSLHPPCPERGQRMDLGSVRVGRGQLHPTLMAGGGWIPHLVLPHPPRSSASSQGVSHFPLVFIPAFPPVRAKAGQPHAIPTETGIRKLRRGN